MKNILVLLLSLSFAGCACWTDASKKNDIGCVVAHAVVDCSTSTVETDYAPFIQIITKLLAGNPGGIDWNQIKQAAEAMGLKDGGCFLAELQNALFSNQMVSPQMVAAYQAIQTALTAYKAEKLKDPSVKFRLVDKATGKEVLL